MTVAMAASVHGVPRYAALSAGDRGSRLPGVNLPKTEFARSGDVYLAYQVLGDGPPDLVLLLGGVAHLELAWEDPMLAKFLTRLASFSRLIRFDRRGFGLSDRVPRLPTFEEQVEDFQAVMDAAGSDRAVIAGMLDASFIALGFAAAHPDRAKSVVTFEAAQRYGPGEDGLGFRMDVLMQLVESAQTNNARRLLELMAPSRADEPGFLEWWNRYSRSGSAAGGLEANMAAMMQWDLGEILDGITAPVLVLHRADAAILPSENGRALAARLSNATLVEVPGPDSFYFSGDVDALVDEIQAFVTGTRPLPRADRVLAAVLFTDIVGSTQRAAALGDRQWKELLDRHHKTVRERLARFGGREIDTAGDGFLATFDSPLRAIEAARGICSAVRPLGLEVRAGVHVGEIELVADDIRGLAVHIGARVASLAGPGEVLVSSTVKDLVAGSGVEFDDRGTHALKGVPGEWRIFAVTQ
jgi:class 3 adenylate cyclase